MMRSALCYVLAAAIGASASLPTSAFAQVTLGPAVIKLAQSSELAKALLFALVQTELTNESNYDSITTETVPWLRKGHLRKHNVTLEPATHRGVVSFKMTVNNLNRKDCQLIAEIMRHNPGPVLGFTVNGTSLERYSGITCKRSILGFGAPNRVEIVGR